jgi:nicotinate-nucleotide adenylyltransferase
MEFLVKARGRPERLAILPGTYHPVTRAHLALAEAALEHTDEVLFAMPRELPHKCYEGVDLPTRLELLRKAFAGADRFSIGVTQRGLFLDIARECRTAYGNNVDLWLLCGRDAAERIVSWDYRDAPAIEEQLREFGLLVADRDGPFVPPPSLQDRMRRLPFPDLWSDVSATEVRRRIAAGEPWEYLVPEVVIPDIRRLYSRS